MPTDAEKRETTKSYLRRKFLGDLPGLKLLADQWFAEATDTVTLTTGSFEGGQGSGIVTFEKMTGLQAVEELIQEIDPDYTPPIPRASGVVVQFGDTSALY